MRDMLGMTAHDADMEAIEALESQVKWLTEEVTDLRYAGDALAERADRFIGYSFHADMARRIALVNEMVAAIEGWSEVRETHDHD